ncbi:hypothetical protein SAMN02910298_00312 [Pseudobutyrivibrio sp. YE44]|uniref:hypothetical protein n=1 Tax=Pseudobutyrivibrio sp. YE44 TaxID=1520802 RepID=UPI000885FDC5|nr:hypothetical protein [Pseudobutyrivibrio sp. YE44]SDB08196.1 hypothetical protein SAMN02910298_00312 [Pseudobutyrivibrio sp. YE44]
MLGINSIGNSNPFNSSGVSNSLTTQGSSQVAKELKAEGKSEALAKSYGSERAAKRAGVIECETCASRKYQDGSDEQVSFKSAAHIAPEAAAARVRGHEQEHVNNAYDKAKEKGGKVLNASVAIHTAVCPECGRTYVSGGTTTTHIKYPNEDNPYQKSRKEADGKLLSGMNFDVGV